MRDANASVDEIQHLEPGLFDNFYQGGCFAKIEAKEIDLLFLFLAQRGIPTLVMSNLELVWKMPIRSMNNASISRVEMMPTNFVIVYNVYRSDLVFVNQQSGIFYTCLDANGLEITVHVIQNLHLLVIKYFCFSGANTLCD